MKVTRGFSIADLRAIQDETKKCKRLDGHAAVFGQTVDIGGYFDEVIERGAFDGCDFSDVLMCVNHDLTKVPLARSRNNNVNSTLRLKMDEMGLYIEADLDVENNQDARTVVSAIERGDIDGMSFIFLISEQKWERMDTDKPLRRVQKIKKVYEAGPVNMPAYSNTDIYARDQQALDSAKIALENARSTSLASDNDALEVERLRTQILLKSNGGM
ncbi:MAG: HK97 family phage prohead protease [Cellulosilyticaceae bacterium]